MDWEYVCVVYLYGLYAALISTAIDKPLTLTPSGDDSHCTRVPWNRVREKDRKRERDKEEDLQNVVELWTPCQRALCVLGQHLCVFPSGSQLTPDLA